MKVFKFACLLLFISNCLFGQEIIPKDKSTQKGEFYVYWGYNRGWFSAADLHLHGDDYNFTLRQVVAKDRQTSFGLDYFHLEKFTIPQYNFRIGYFIKDHYSISIGTDHMKYVLQQNQIVKIDGNINVADSRYNGTYENEDLKIVDDFLHFEHTDGLNYGNIDIRRFDTFFAFKKMKVSLSEGLGFGLLIPRTNATLLGHERYDQFHLSGYGVNALASLHVSFWDLVFLQSEIKGGFINMPNIRTTASSSDTASQSFLFSQLNFLVGFQFSLRK